MMRGRRAMAVAVRHPSGQIVVHSEPLNQRVYGSPWAKRPFFRGMLMLWDTLALGMRALVFSANVALDEDEESTEADKKAAVSATSGTTTSNGAATANDVATHSAVTPDEVQEKARVAAKDAFGGGVMWGTMAVALLFGVGLFFISPLLLTRVVDPLLPNAAVSVVVEGAIRITFFFGYVWLIGRIGDVRRVFAYHGAEHRTINAFEAGEPLVPERVQRYSVAHPRCGTAFLLYVVVLSIFVFGVLGRPSLPVRLATRVLLVPVIASVAYEVIRFSARRQANRGVRALLVPGLALQSLTTREPDEAQVEVAIAALKRVMDIDGTPFAVAAGAQGDNRVTPQDGDNPGNWDTPVDRDIGKNQDNAG
jgi:uncharacterized protein YqhQ